MARTKQMIRVKQMVRKSNIKRLRDKQWKFRKAVEYFPNIIPTEGVRKIVRILQQV
jgi:hypothetical protein